MRLAWVSLALLLGACLMGGCAGTKEGPTDLPPRFIYVYPELGYDAHHSWIDRGKVEEIESRVSRTVSRELGLERDLSVQVDLKIPRAMDRHGVFEVRDGVMHGELLVDFEGRISTRVAHQFIYFLAHEMTEFAMSSVSYLGRALYENDIYLRWVGDGISNHVATKALIACREFISPIDHRIEAIDLALGAGFPTVTLHDWRLDFEGELKSGATTFSRYSAAEYLIDRWVDSCRRHRVDDPVARFFAWIEQGPPSSYEAVIDWMNELSDIDVGREARQVALADARAHFQQRSLSVRVIHAGG